MGVEIVGVVVGALRCEMGHGAGAVLWGRIPGSLEGAPPGADAGGNQGKSQNTAFTREVA